MVLRSSPAIGQHFAYAQGRIGVLKQYLLTQTDVDRLLGAPDRAAVEQIFTELTITDGIDQSLQDGDAILLAVAQWMRREVENMTPLSKQSIFHIHWLEGDAPLLAYLLKTYHGLPSEISEEPISGFSAYQPDKLRDLVQNGTVSDLPSHLTDFVDRIKKLSNPSPKEIDTEVAIFMARTKLQLAKTSGSKEIRRYVQHSIDASNIRTALRLRDYDPRETLPYLLPGGTVNVQELSVSHGSILNAIKRSELSYHLTDLLQQDTIDVNAVEQALTHVLAADIARMWNVPLSIEPVFAFAAITSFQLKIMRMILIGKRNELTPQEIKRALPPFISASHYVSS